MIFMSFSILCRLKMTKYQNSKPVIVLKRHILRLYMRQLWFHVKSEWQKNSAISTLCYIYVPPFVSLAISETCRNKWDKESSSKSIWNCSCTILKSIFAAWKKIEKTLVMKIAFFLFFCPSYHLFEIGYSTYDHLSLGF